MQSLCEFDYPYPSAGSNSVYIPAFKTILIQASISAPLNNVG